MIIFHPGSYSLHLMESSKHGSLTLSSVFANNVTFVELKIAI